MTANKTVDIELTSIWLEQVFKTDGDHGILAVAVSLKLGILPPFEGQILPKKPWILRVFL